MRLTLNSKPLDKWDQRFCELARYVSEWSKDPNARVGAVLYAKRGGDITVGYNGFPIGVEDSIDRLEDRTIKQEMVVHAEQNAVIAAGARADGATVYVWGKPICARCAGVMIQAGVARVVALNPESTPAESKWRLLGIYAKQMFEEAGVIMDFYEFVAATDDAVE